MLWTPGIILSRALTALEKKEKDGKSRARIFEKENEERLNYDSHAFLYFVASLKLA